MISACSSTCAAAKFEEFLKLELKRGREGKRDREKERERERERERDREHKAAEPWLPG